jgi:UrcA family protein
MTISGRILVGAVVSVISLGYAAAYADSAPAVAVRFGDLNLSQPRDLARLYSRITAAANETCGPRSFGRFELATADYKSCYSDTVANAVANIARPSVTAYFKERSAELAAGKERLALE